MRAEINHIAPVLLCLNLQKAFLASAGEAGAAQSALAHAHFCIDWARRNGLRIIHIHTACGDRSADLARIPGFEIPRSEAIVFKRAPSVFDSLEFREAASDLQHGFVVGLSGAGDCIETALDAHRAGIRLLFIADAVATSYPSHLQDGVWAVLGTFAGVVSTADLMAHNRNVGGFGFMNKLESACG
jgi:nicotinamidase-related amidase